MVNSDSLRIVSLLPGATELIAALGLSDTLVGRSHECDYPSEIQKLPVCTQAKLDSHQSSAEIDANVRQLVQNALSIYSIKTEMLEKLRPTHILTQDQCDVCAVSLADVEKAVATLTHTPSQIISLQPEVFADIWTDIERVAEIFNVDAQPLLTQLQKRVKDCTQTIETLSSRPTVAALEWIEPLMASGNWIPELIQLAGGQPQFGVAGKHSPYLDWETLLEQNPEIIIIMPCGFDLERTRQESQRLIEHSQWSQLRAVQNNKVYITDGNAYFNRPGPRLVDSLEILAEILHPTLFNTRYQGKAWEQLTLSAKV